MESSASELEKEALLESSPVGLKKLLAIFLIMVGIYAFMTSGLGPLMPALRADLHLSYTLGALHFSAMSLGLIVAGSFGERMLRAVGRRNSMWIGVAGACVGLLLLVIGHVPPVTICGAFITGTMGCIMGQTIDTVIAEAYSKDKTVIFTIVTVVCSLTSTAAPGAVGFSLGTPLGWRLPLIATVVAYAVCYLLFGRVALPERTSYHKEETSGTLPVLYWIYWTVILFGCASEWSIADWSSDFLEHVAHLPRADAASAVSVFFGAMLTARIAGIFLSSRVHLSRLLISTASLALVGFLVFWLGPNWKINVLGLFVAGVGTANMFPLVLSAALSACAGKTGMGASRINVASGLSGLVGPLALGCLAEHIGIFKSYGVVALLLSVALSLIVFATYRASKIPSPI